MTDSQHLAWIVGRLINVYGENPSVDYMIRLQEIVKRLNLPSKAEPKEWPQVGDAVTWGNSVDNFKLLAVHEGSAWVVMQTDGHNDYGIIPVSELKKPKTEVEILRDELIELAFNQFNDDSHPLDRNAYYLISELMDKYNITKKAQP